MPPAVPLQERSLRAVPCGISPLCDDVTAGEAGAGIPVSRERSKKWNCHIGEIPGGITSTIIIRFSGYKEVV